MSDMENAPVVFRVRFGKEIFTCKGRLVRDRGATYAIVDEIPDDCPFPPDRVRLEEEDLELKQADAGAFYQYHGFVFIY